MQYQCKKCGANFDIPDERIRPEGSSFKCNNCGTGFVLRHPSAAAAAPQAPPPGAVACPRCGGINGSLARFCTHCGNPLTPMPHYAGRATHKEGTHPAVIAVIVIAVGLFGMAVLGIIAAIAIPAFLGQREMARMRALEANYTMALSVVQEELRKCSTGPGSVTSDVVARLNESESVFNPWAPESLPFSSSFGLGQVSISRPDLRSMCGTDSEVVVMADAMGDGIEDDEYVTVLRVSDVQGSSFDLRPPPERGGHRQPDRIDI